MSRRQRWSLGLVVALGAVALLVVQREPEPRGALGSAPQVAWVTAGTMYVGLAEANGGIPAGLTVGGGFKASDDGTLPENLSVQVIIENLVNITGPSPTVLTSTDVHDGDLWIQVQLQFAAGQVAPESEIDIRVIVGENDGRVSQESEATLTLTAVVEID